MALMGSLSSWSGIGGDAGSRGGSSGKGVSTLAPAGRWRCQSLRVRYPPEART